MPVFAGFFDHTSRTKSPQVVPAGVAGVVGFCPTLADRDGWTRAIVNSIDRDLLLSASASVAALLTENGSFVGRV
jgi:hypothetical protein